MSEMRHYWIPCTKCKKVQYAGVEPGTLVPVAACCAACDPEGSSSVTYRNAARHKAGPLAPCCLTAGDTPHEPQLPETK